MYDGVISVSDGFNPRATVSLKDKLVKTSIDNIKLQKREVSFLTALVCAKITKQLATGYTKEEKCKENRNWLENLVKVNP